jgi:hypothetical protein
MASASNQRKRQRNGESNGGVSVINGGGISGASGSQPASAASNISSSMATSAAAWHEGSSEPAAEALKTQNGVNYENGGVKNES